MLEHNRIDWLLEKDDQNPGVRYFALKDLHGLPESDKDVRAAREAIMHTGPVPVILDAQEPSGYWVKTGSGYSPKYRASVWSVIILAELGANPDEPRVRKGCENLLENSLATIGAFSAYQDLRPSGALHCLNGNLLYALQRLGYADDPRVQSAIRWLAKATVEEPTPNFSNGAAGQDFVCWVNLDKPCGWGANKTIRGLLEVPPERRTPEISRALEAGARFLLSHDPAVADYPYTERVSSHWFKLGFPLSYWSDVLETVSNLVGLGYGDDSRLQPAIEWIMNKKGDQGRWKLENSPNGKMWADIEVKGKPSKWVTLRALRVLKEVGVWN